MRGHTSTYEVWKAKREGEGEGGDGGDAATVTRKNDQKVHPSPRSVRVLVLFFMEDVSRSIREVCCVYIKCRIITTPVSSVVV